jgi:hypothetical protein
MSLLRFGKELKDLLLGDIQFLIDEKIDESQNLEYKQPTQDHQKDCDNLAEVIAGFLNTDGGIIVYGVSEKKEKEHRYPDKIIWSICTKEKLENLLVSRVQPWDERIRMRRIENERNLQEGIFIIEVPKSNNPPHMSNYVYHQRLNFQTKPMEHESVYRVFQTSWIRRRDISKNVIEPLYAEIKSNCWCIKNYRGTLDGKYRQVVDDTTFLYDKLEPLIKQNIDEFYDRLEKYHFVLNEVNRLTSRMINEELCRVKPDLKDLVGQRMGEMRFYINLYLKDSEGNVDSRKGYYIEDILLKKKSLRKYLQSLVPFHKIVKIEPIIETPFQHTIDMTELKDFWEGLKVEVKQNSMYQLMWKERLELLSLGKTILKEMKG